MLFGALFSAYALLRVAATDWPSGREVLNLSIGSINTIILLTGTASVWRARRLPGVHARTWLAVGSACALVFLALKGWEYSHELGAGLRPATNTFLAMYFTLTGLHALHVVAGIVANVWAIAGVSGVTEAMTAGRTRSLALYWVFVDIVWLIIFGLMYLL
jgi:heme/copper-type cytochrome/quinol oxidase subunit 3